MKRKNTKQRITTDVNNPSPDLTIVESQERTRQIGARPMGPSSRQDFRDEKNLDAPTARGANESAKRSEDKILKKRS